MVFLHKASSGFETLTREGTRKQKLPHQPRPRNLTMLPELSGHCFRLSATSRGTSFENQVTGSEANIFGVSRAIAPEVLGERLPRGTSVHTPPFEHVPETLQGSSRPPRRKQTPP